MAGGPRYSQMSLVSMKQLRNVWYKGGLGLKSMFLH